jgi:hypothetical protein
MPGYRVQVINHGHGWWFSSQEVAHFLALLRIEPAPQVAVFLDGFNDVTLVAQGYEPTYFTSILWDGWESERERRRYPAPRGAWLELTQSFPPTRLRRLMGQKRLTYINLSPSISYPARFRRVPGDPAGRVLDVIRSNRKVAGGIADAFGIQVHFFLQPTSFFRGTEAWQRPGMNETVYRSLIVEERDGKAPRCTSLHDALDGMERPYIDSIHYNEEASRILGARMAEQIRRDWASRGDGRATATPERP